jgi:hypothetical protein
VILRILNLYFGLDDFRAVYSFYNDFLFVFSPSSS